jgi:hypothetical protein
VKDKIIQPINAYVYQPYINPALAKTAMVLTNGSSWMNSNVYQPYIKPTLEKAKQTVITYFPLPLGRGLELRAG